MFPATFEYFSPTTVDEAVELLKKYSFEAKILSGGQSLLPMMKLRIAMPSVVIDINKIEAFREWKEENGYLRIGSLVRHADLERDTRLQQQYPLLSETAAWIADPPVRNMGTLCGSLVHADPGSDWGAAMLALRAELEAVGPEGTRRIPIDHFFVDTFTTSLDTEEVVSAVNIPAPTGKVASRYKKLERKAGDFAIVGVALHVMLSDDGTVKDAGIGLCACGDIPLRAESAEQVLIGGKLDPASIEATARQAMDAADPASDLRGSAEYKKDMVRVFVERGLCEIAEELGL